MRRPKIFLLGAVLALNWASAQESPTRVLSNLEPVELPERVAEQLQPEFEVQAVDLSKNAGRSVRLCRVRTPVFPDLPEDEPLTEEQVQALSEQLQQLAAEQPQEASKTIIVASTTFNRELTHFWWLEDGEFYEAWSTIDFNYLEGFTDCQVEGQRYTLLLFHSSIDVEELPEHPTFPQGGESYVLNEDLLEGAENIPEILHKLYAAEEEKLKEAFVFRQQRRLEEKAAREEKEAAKKDKEIVIHYWPKKSERYKHLIEEE